MAKLTLYCGRRQGTDTCNRHNICATWSTWTTLFCWVFSPSKVWMSGNSTQRAKLWFWCISIISTIMSKCQLWCCATLNWHDIYLLFRYFLSSQTHLTNKWSECSQPLGRDSFWLVWIRRCIIRTQENSKKGWKCLLQQFRKPFRTASSVYTISGSRKIRVWDSKLWHLQV